MLLCAAKGALLYGRTEGVDLLSRTLDQTLELLID